MSYFEGISNNPTLQGSLAWAVVCAVISISYFAKAFGYLSMLQSRESPFKFTFQDVLDFDTGERFRCELLLTDHLGLKSPRGQKVSFLYNRTSENEWILGKAKDLLVPILFAGANKNVYEISYEWGPEPDSPVPSEILKFMSSVELRARDTEVSKCRVRERILPIDKPVMILGEMKKIPTTEFESKGLAVGKKISAFGISSENITFCAGPVEELQKDLSKRATFEFIMAVLMICLGLLPFIANSK
jgi:hypothetical protein